MKGRERESRAERKKKSDKRGFGSCKVGRDVVGGEKILMRAPNVLWEVRRAAGRDFLARTTKHGGWGRAGYL
jgi:hypothetical protein